MQNYGMPYVVTFKYIFYTVTQNQQKCIVISKRFLELSVQVLYDQYMQMGSKWDGLVDLTGYSQEP